MAKNWLGKWELGLSSGGGGGAVVAVRRGGLLALSFIRNYTSVPSGFYFYRVVLLP